MFLIELIRKVQKINSYPIHDFVNDYDTTTRKSRYKTTRKIQISLKLILMNKHDM